VLVGVLLGLELEDSRVVDLQLRDVPVQARLPLAWAQTVSLRDRLALPARKYHVQVQVSKSGGSGVKEPAVSDD
jgi:hypothetical protein